MLLKKNDTPQDSYDVIVIGSGLGGLTAANSLARRGKKVLLLEAHNKLGGLATWFKRPPSHIFDVSLHGFPYGMVKTCRKYWGKELSDMIIPITKLKFTNPQYSIETSYTKDDFIKILENNFGIETDTIFAFFDEVGSYDLSTPSTLTAKDLFEKYFPNRKDVQRFLLEPITYANGHTLEDPALSFGIVFSNFMKKGVYTVSGGTDAFILKMRDILVSNGADIKLHSKVEKIIVSDKKVEGVILPGSKQLVKCKAVISNGSLINTVENLVGSSNFSKSFTDDFKNVRANTSSCQVYMGIKKGTILPDLPDLIFHSEANEFSTNELLDINTTSRTFSIYRPEIRPTLDQYAIVSSTNARYEDWKNLSKEEYVKEKQKMIDITLKTLEKILPGVTKEIDTIDAATPLTVENYTHHYGGSSFGTKFEGLGISQRLPSEVEGLYHAGSVGIIMSGWLGAANYGVIVANEVLNLLESK